ncbi:hypothetical protein [Streptomyces sp. NPDC051636]|uniref:hypothetical protein n=1 Tax=Streptomyces sp. NPDC051636 TaxID=3365663 RepID=UPI00379D4F4B
MAASTSLAIPDDVGAWSAADWAFVVVITIVGVVLFTAGLLAAVMGGPVWAGLALLAVIVVWLLGHYVWTTWLAPFFGVS